MSNTWCSRLCSRSSASNVAASTRPSPSCMRSAVVSVRADEVITIVRSGVAQAQRTWRAVSSSSEETRASSAPGTGFRLNTGRRPPSAACGCGNTSR